MSKSYDLSTSTKWANLADGEHIVKLKSKGSGYGTSSFSNSVTVTKGATGETWVLNSSISGDLSEVFIDFFTIDDSGTKHNCSSIECYTDSGYRIVRYKFVPGGYEVVYYTYLNIYWKYDYNRTITFLQPVTDATLLAWLQANGTKQGGG